MIHLRVLVPSLLVVAAAMPAADSSYLVPVSPGVVIKPIATAGDSLPAGADATGISVPGTKAVVGIPDGMGGFDNGDGTFTLIANHELGTDRGAVRAHGQKGAFLSRFRIRSSDLGVETLADQITTALHYDKDTQTWSGTPDSDVLVANATAAQFARFCSGDLPTTTALYNRGSGRGLPAATGHLYLNGEEAGANGRAFAHAVSGAYAGQSLHLPHLGMTSWENVLVSPHEQDQTIAIGLDDSTPGQLYVYVGQKEDLSTMSGTTGDVVDWARAAGLVGGSLYGIVANGQAAEVRDNGAGIVGVGPRKGLPAPFTLASVGSPATVSAWTSGVPMDAVSVATGVTNFLRPEDGAWDPVRHNTFYFLTTDAFDTTKNGGSGASTTTVARTRLWKLVFNDITQPTLGGSITMLIDGSENPGPQMMDNMAVDRAGRILIQEDPGGQAHSAAIWLYDTADGSLRKIAKHDPSRFGDRGYGSAGVLGETVLPVSPFTNDEESSGIFDAQDLLGAGWFLFNVQAHTTTGATTETVERGQFAALYVPFTQGAGSTVQAGNLTTVTLGTTVIPVRDGGLGSALAPVAGRPGEFWGLTDRGPNVNHPTLANTKLFPKPEFTPNLRRFKLNGDGTTTILEQIQLKRPDGSLLTGLPLPAGSDGWTGETAYALSATGAIGTAALSDTFGLDSEGLVAHPNGTFWISDEYGPFIAVFSSTGQQIGRFSPFAAATINGVSYKLPAVLRNREANRGMEGLTLTPDGSRLVGLMQSPLANSATPGSIAAGSGSGQSRRLLATRLIEITLATGAVREFFNLQEARSTSNCDILALSNTKFLVLERDGNFSSVSGAARNVWQIDLDGAVNINDPTDGVNGKIITVGGVAGSYEDHIKRIAGNSPTKAQVDAALKLIGATAAAKSSAPVLDLASYKGVWNHDKAEGMALLGDTLYIINDDDFGVTDEDADGVLSTLTAPILAKHVHGTATTQTVDGVTGVKAGLQDFTQILPIRLSAIGSPIVAINAIPSISNIADQSVRFSASTGALAFTVGDVETAAASLVVTASSGNTTVVPAAGVVLGGSGANRTITVTTATAGTAVITVTVSDGTASAVDTFTVTATNTAPLISAIANRTVTVGASTGALAFTVSDAETAAGSLVVTAVSSNTTAVPASRITLGGSGTNRTIAVAPAAAGTAIITISVSDGLSTTLGTFTVTASDGSTPPTSGGDSDSSSGCGAGSGLAGLGLILLAVLRGLGLASRRR